MKKVPETSSDPDMAAEYDFSKAVRGKYASRFPSGTRVVVISADVAEVFPDSASVNRALRRLIRTPTQAPYRVLVKGKKRAPRAKGRRG
jgi:hypothetical protein